jgi:hypothetical protein
VPGAEVVKGADVAPPAVTGWVFVKTGAPAHVASLGPYRRTVIVPVGLTAPASVAVSVTVPPTGTAGDANVEMVGVAWPTTTDSPASLQAPATAALLASPE